MLKLLLLTITPSKFIYSLNTVECTPLGTLLLVTSRKLEVLLLLIISKMADLAVDEKSSWHPVIEDRLSNPISYYVPHHIWEKGTNFHFRIHSLRS